MKQPPAHISVFSYPVHSTVEQNDNPIPTRLIQPLKLSREFERACRECRGFSLIEVLLAMTLMSVLMYFVAPAIAPINKASQLSDALRGITTTLEQARSYAMANKTYVYVGFYESSITASADVLVSGNGKIWVGVAASKDGTKNNSPALIGTQMTPIDRLRYYERIHLTDPTTTGVAGIVSGASSLLDSTHVTGFGWPLISADKIPAFSWVVQFSPQGNAVLPSPAGNLAPYISIGLRQSNGNASSSNNTAVIQISGITGTIQIVRLE